jgi:DNA-binding XRE family transcriptional regulator
MNQIQRLKAGLAKQFPDLAIELDAPDDENGPWFLDVRRGGDASPIVVEWRPDRGFGVSTLKPDDFGSSADEVYSNARIALGRVAQLVLSGGETRPRGASSLAGLRRAQRLSQAEVAERAGVKQANIAKIEARDDIHISTLLKYVSAIGGKVLIRVQFDDGREQKLEGLKGL